MKFAARRRRWSIAHGNLVELLRSCHAWVVVGLLLGLGRDR